MPIAAPISAVMMISSGRGLHDVTNPVMAAIYAIGGEPAIAGYDGLLALGGDFRRLRNQRTPSRRPCSRNVG
jgi:hypothetical protein